MGKDRVRIVRILFFHFRLGWLQKTTEMMHEGGLRGVLEWGLERVLHPAHVKVHTTRDPERSFMHASRKQGLRQSNGHRICTEEKLSEIWTDQIFSSQETISLHSTDSISYLFAASSEIHRQ
jgi:hypothetical protein